MHHIEFTLFILIILPVLVSCGEPEVEFSDWELVASNQQFPEGPAWDPRGTLYVSNCNGGWITSVSNSVVDTFLVASDSTFKQTNGLTVAPNGDLLACDFGLGAILRISPSGEVTTLVAGFDGKPFNRPNDLTLDGEGDLYFTDPKSYGKDIDGRVFCFDLATKELKLVADSLDFPNGLGISPIDGRLYVCESARHRVLAFDVLENGDLANKQAFVSLPGGDPDGMAFDVRGNMYVAHFGGGAVVVISPEGQVIDKIGTPGKKPSNVEFGDQDMKTLYLTEDETNSTFRLHTNVPGRSRP